MELILDNSLEIQTFPVNTITYVIDKVENELDTISGLISLNSENTLPETFPKASLYRKEEDLVLMELSDLSFISRENNRYIFKARVTQALGDADDSNL